MSAPLSWLTKASTSAGWFCLPVTHSPILISVVYLASASCVFPEVVLKCLRAVSLEAFSILRGGILCGAKFSQRTYRNIPILRAFLELLFASPGKSRRTLSSTSGTRTACSRWFRLRQQKNVSLAKTKWPKWKRYRI